MTTASERLRLGKPSIWSSEQQLQNTAGYFIRTPYTHFDLILFADPHSSPPSTATSLALNAPVSGGSRSAQAFRTTRTSAARLHALPSALKRAHVFVVVFLRIHEHSMHTSKDFLSCFGKRKVRSSNVIWTLPVGIVRNAGLCRSLS
ncbi:hypothetical protein KC320_g183 [Hortaea werneckii]|nr:hypothetical protein KC320_g183 [Hortaea werneckii]